ncbi:MAG: glycosyltransferase family 4 protein [Halobacteriota archaeon]|nr:glycosyltransferase family 4 protein [Halobacteriota archaeon]
MARDRWRIAIFTGTIDLVKQDARGIYIIEILKYLVKFKDLEIVLITPDNIKNKLVENDNITHIEYRLFDRAHFRYFSTMVFSIPKLVLNDFDLLHSFGHEATSIARIAKKIKRDILIIPHFYGLSTSETEIYSKYSIKKKVIRPFMTRREKLIIKQPYGKTVLSEAMKDFLVEVYKIPEENIFVTPIGIEPKPYKDTYNKDTTLLKKLGIDGKKIILYAGWISALHGVIDLVKAIEIINIKNKDLILLIVGFGPLEPLIKDYVKRKQIKNVFFVGKVPHEEINRYLSIADVLVIPHVRCMQTELNPTTKLFEYLASGKPIVSSKLKPIVDIVGDNAVLVEPEDPQSIADGISRLLNDEALSKELGENGKEIVDNYSWEETAKKLHEAYLSILKN